MLISQNDQFLGKFGDRTLFSISIATGVSIQKYSAVPCEEEVLLLPGTCLDVESELDLGNGLHLVQMKEAIVPGLIDMPRPDPFCNAITAAFSVLLSPMPSTFPFVREWFMKDWEKICVEYGQPVQKVKILDISKIGNARLLNRFEAKCASMKAPNIKWLWHGTANLFCSKADCGRRDCSLCGISSAGFQPEKARKFGHSFEHYGSATYFGNRAYIPHNYNGQNEKALGAGVRAVILSRVAAGKTGFYFEKGDSTWQWSDVGEMSRVMDGDKRNLIGRQDPDDGSAHFMVDDSRQINPEYVVLYQYPESFRERVPWSMSAGVQVIGCNKEIHFCAFHNMIHGDVQSCDAHLGSMSCV